jgi:hypothetical protein
MERSAIRGRHRRGTEVPDYAPLHPGYRMSYNTHPPAGGLAITPRTNRILTAVIFAVLWTAGMLYRAPVLDLQTVGTALVVGVIVAFLVYWLLDKFSGRLRG